MTEASRGTAEAGTIALDDLDTATAYKLLVGAAQPRPIAWVSTVSEEGTANLAPFSFFTVASREPATLLISVTKRIDGAVKHTLANVLETGDMVINIPTRGHLEAVQISSEEVPADVDEHQLAGLAILACDEVRAPRLASVGMSLECRLDRTVEVGIDTLILVRVLKVHTAPGVIDSRFRVDNSLLQPLGRLAGPWYTAVETEIPAPTFQTTAGA